MNVDLVWSTPNAEELLAKMARVSNPSNQDNKETAPRLIAYLIKHKHWSPFEMIDACFEIECPRDISRQLLRHTSFRFQEFSQRYAEVTGDLHYREARLQDDTNRQNSILTYDYTLTEDWDSAQEWVYDTCKHEYDKAIKRGIAKEVARVLLPEGLTQTKMYMKGNMRSWMHYCQVRMGNGTQKEHQEIAEQIYKHCISLWPVSFKELGNE